MNTNKNIENSLIYFTKGRESEEVTYPFVKS